jgi:hypothetical protein
VSTHVVTLDAVQQAVLAALADTPAPPGGQPPTADQVLLSFLGDRLAEAGKMNQEKVLTTLLAKFFAADATAQGQVLTMLGLTDFAALPPESQRKAFRALATPAFLALDYQGQVEVCAALGF